MLEKFRQNESIKKQLAVSKDKKFQEFLLTKSRMDDSKFFDKFLSSGIEFEVVPILARSFLPPRAPGYQSPFRSNHKQTH